MEIELYKKIIDSLYDGVYFVDNNKKITFWSKSAERITGFKQKEVIGSCCSDNILRHIDKDGNDLCLSGCPLGATLKDGKARESDVYLHHKDGHRVPVSVRATSLINSSGQIIGAVEIFQDISKREDIIKELESLWKEALRDNLTGVGNRRFAEITLEKNLHEFSEFSVPFGAIFLDIDHFKKFNDTYGHNIGDQILVMVSKTIANLLRTIDSIARWGGEEFVVIVSNTDQGEIAKIAERIRVFIEKSWLNVYGRNRAVTVSVGGTLFKEGETMESLIHRADSLMCQSKENGCNRVTIG